MAPAPPAEPGDDSELWAARAGAAGQAAHRGLLPDGARDALRELAALLECSEDAARRNVHEGLKRLREEWTHDH